MHVDDDGIHARERLGRLVHDEVGPLGDDLQLVVGDDRGDLDDDVLGRIEAGHLEVHPDEHRAQATGRRVTAIYRGAMPHGLVVPVVRLDPELPLPSYARAGDAGLDLVAREGATLAPGGGRALIPTGIAFAIPEGYAGFVQPRSGLALRHGITCLNTPGLIDAGYRDELKVLLVNLDPREPFEVQRGERIAQLVVQAVARVEWSPWRRSTAPTAGGGFGSTGR